MNLLKKILHIAFWMLLIAGLGMVFAFVQNKENETLCPQLNISIKRNLPNGTEYVGFVEEDDIRKMLSERFGQVENIPLKNIDVYRLERLMYENPWVAKADVHLSINGVVNVEIVQRHPLLRIINLYGESYYMDSNGQLMPWSPKFTPRLFVATGNIKEKFEQWRNIPVDKIINNDTLKTITLLDDFYIIAQFILADEFWSAHIEQIYLNQYGDMELVPKVGNHKIIFGTSEQMEEKFWKLKTFYKQGLNYTGWENYDTLNLKFQNQVVCTKKLKEQDSKEEITAR